MGYRPRRSSRKNNTTLRLSAIIVTLVIAIATGGVGSFGGCAQLAQLLPGALTQRFSNAASVSTLGDIPAYSGSATVYINADTAHPQGAPAFTLEEISRAQSGAFTEFSRLDTPAAAEPLSPVWDKKRCPPNRAKVSRMYIPAGGTSAATSLSTKAFSTTAVIWLPSPSAEKMTTSATSSPEHEP